MRILSPSILAADFARLGEQIRAVEDAGAQYLHIDVMDGIFVPQISFGMPLIKSIRKSTDIFFDVHIMIDRPERYVAEFVDCGANMVTFHLEATQDVYGTIAAIRAKGAKVGISIKPGTPVEEVLPYIKVVDMVLIMTVEPGYGGQKYIDYCTDKVRAVREYIMANNYKCDVQVDGGVDLSNVKEVIDAGANVVVAGSAVFKDDIAQNVKSFLEIMG